MNVKSKSFNEDLEYRVFCLKHIGKKYGWKIIREDKAQIEFESVILYEKQTTVVSLRVKYEPIEIESQLNHPFKGETTLLRKGDLSLKMVEQIFRNPRTHTQKGEYS